MSRGKYLLPVVMGRPGQELFIVRGGIPRGQKCVLAKQVLSRVAIEADLKHIERLSGPGNSNQPTKVREIATLSPATVDLVSTREASLICGYINNTLPGAFKAPEMSEWYIYDKSGDISPLKLSRFSINLLDTGERNALVELLKGMKISDKGLRSYK